MSDMRYEPEVLGEDEDDGTMPSNVAALAEHVVGHRIVNAEKVTRKQSYGAGLYSWSEDVFILTLDDGRKVELVEGEDCCAYTALESFLLDPSSVDHVITGVGTTDGFTTWHVYADMGDVLTMQVGWSCGNPFYYSYGFTIRVSEEGS